MIHINLNFKMRREYNILGIFFNPNISRTCLLLRYYLHLYGVTKSPFWSFFITSYRKIQTNFLANSMILVLCFNWQNRCLISFKANLPWGESLPSNFMGVCNKVSCQVVQWISCYLWHWVNETRRCTHQCPAGSSLYTLPLTQMDKTEAVCCKAVVGAAFCV